MSALKHGLFRVGFMLCDRCAVNASCGRFRPGAECELEREAYEGLVGRLSEEYDLDGVADRILAERTAMYLVRLARAESYEALVGVSERSVLWGGYISRLDRELRGFLNDLAVTRWRRKQLEGGEALLVGVEDLLERLVKRAEGREVKRPMGKKLPWKLRMFVRGPGLRVRPATVYRRILVDWRREKEELLKRTRG